MNTALHYGMGLGATGQQILGTVGGTLMQYGAYIPVAGPFVVIAGAITELLAAIGIGRRCGQTCIVASQYANQAESLLQQNYNAYFALSTPRPKSAQQMALGNFDQIWNGLVQVCSNPPLSDAGKRCVSDRQAGACTWKGSDDQCWNWFSGYRDPIANDAMIDDTLPSMLSPLPTGRALMAGNLGGWGWAADLRTPRRSIADRPPVLYFNEWRTRSAEGHSNAAQHGCQKHEEVRFRHRAAQDIKGSLCISSGRLKAAPKVPCH